MARYAKESTMANPNDEAGVDRLVADARAMDKLNQSVIAEFRANGGRVGGDLEECRSCC
jgi:hypothetical protein